MYSEKVKKKIKKELKKPVDSHPRAKINNFLKVYLGNLEEITAYPPITTKRKSFILSNDSNISFSLS